MQPSLVPIKVLVELVEDLQKTRVQILLVKEGLLLVKGLLLLVKGLLLLLKGLLLLVKDHLLKVLIHPQPESRHQETTVQDLMINP